MIQPHLFYLTNYSKCLLLYYIIKYCVIYAKNII